MTFAIQAILHEVRERRRKWTWAYFAERRDDRNEYVEFFKRKIMGTLQETVCVFFFYCKQDRLSYLAIGNSCAASIGKEALI